MQGTCRGTHGLLGWFRGILLLNQAASWLANIFFRCTFSMQCTHADLALQDEDMEEYDDDEEAEEVDEDDMGEDDEEEDEEEEDNYEEETDGRPFINLYHDTYEEEEDGEEEEDEEEEDGDEGEERAEGLLEVDDDALGVEGRPGTSWDQFEHMLGSGYSATRARRMELAGKSVFCCC